MNDFGFNVPSTAKVILGQEFGIWKFQIFFFYDTLCRTVHWWRKPEDPEKTTDLRQVLSDFLTCASEDRTHSGERLVVSERAPSRGVHLGGVVGLACLNESSGYAGGSSAPGRSNQAGLVVEEGQDKVLRTLIRVPVLKLFVGVGSLYRIAFFFKVIGFFITHNYSFLPNSPLFRGLGSRVVKSSPVNS